MTAIITATVHAFASGDESPWRTILTATASTAIASFLWNRDRQAQDSALRPSQHPAYHLHLEVRDLSDRVGALEAGQRNGLQLLSVLIDETRARSSAWRDNEPVIFPDPDEVAQNAWDDLTEPLDPEDIAERRKATDPSGPQALPSR